MAAWNWAIAAAMASGDMAYLERRAMLACTRLMKGCIGLEIGSGMVRPPEVKRRWESDGGPGPNPRSTGRRGDNVVRSRILRPACHLLRDAADKVVIGAILRRT